MDMNENKRRRSMLLYVLIAIIAYLAISQALGTNLTASRVTAVEYSQFVDMVEKNEVTQAESVYGNPEITFTTGEGDSQKLYTTVLWNGTEESTAQLLDEHGASWEDAVEIVGSCFSFRPDEGARDARVPLGAIAALQPRDAGLIRAVNEKLCERLWRTWPGDWLRIGASAVIRDEEADLSTLCAALCGRINCSKERRAGSLRAMYVLMPAKFADI